MASSLLILILSTIAISSENCLPWSRGPLVNEICALTVDQNEESLRTGDSGAPVVCDDKLFAIVIRTLSRTSVKGAVVLQVANYIRWIASIINAPQ